MAQIVLKMKANDGYDQFIGFTANKNEKNHSLVTFSDIQLEVATNILPVPSLFVFIYSKNEL